MNSTQPTPQPERNQRKWPGVLLRLLLLLILLVTTLLAWLPYLLPHVLQQQGITLQWQQPRWSLQGLQLQQLRLEQGNLQLQLHDLQLAWRWQKFPLQSISIGKLVITGTLPQQSEQPGSTDNQLLTALAPWLPGQLDIYELHAKVDEMAHVTGSIHLQAGAQRPLWQPRHLALDLVVEQLHPRWLEGFPAGLQPESLRIRTLSRNTDDPLSNALQELSLDIHSLGQSQFQLSGILTLLQEDGWQGRLEQARLHLELPRYKLGSLQLQQLQAQLYFNAKASTQGFGLQLTQPASLTAAQLLLEQRTRLQQITATLPRLQLETSFADDNGTRLQADYHLSIEKLQDPVLSTQTWSAAGHLSGLLTDLQITTAINNTSGLELDGDWHWHTDGLNGNLVLKDIFLRAGNPLQASLTDWPDLVEFSNGRLNARTSLSLPVNAPLQISGHVTGSGLDGIVNRSELGKLDFSAFFRLDHGEQLQVDIPRLTVGELDPGVPLQHLIARQVSYSGHIDRLPQGTAAWQEVSGQVLGGEFTLPANRIRLDRENPMQLQLSGLLLQDALALYPAEGLHGQATIDGNLPLTIGPSGIYVAQGWLQARQPGILRFQSEQIRSLGQTNPSMQLVAEALEDFHFSLLDSKLDYEPSGKLVFNIRLEGQNPAVKNGRPIHLNLNLEEDLPALLASIQLSNHVSETIQERIRQRLQNR